MGKEREELTNILAFYIIVVLQLCGNCQIWFCKVIASFPSRKETLITLLKNKCHFVPAVNPYLVIKCGKEEVRSPVQKNTVHAIFDTQAIFYRRTTDIPIIIQVRLNKISWGIYVLYHILCSPKYLVLLWCRANALCYVFSLYSERFSFSKTSTSLFIFTLKHLT